MSSPLKRSTLERKHAVSRFRASERWMKGGSMKDLKTYMVKEYLARYPHILEEFLLDNASVEFLQDILKKIRSRPKCWEALLKQQQSVEEITNFYTVTGTECFCHKILNCATDTEICEVINEMSRVIGYTINAEGFSLYLIGENGTDVLLYEPGKEFRYLGPVGKNMTVSAYVAMEKISINVKDLPQDSRFPKGIGLGDDRTHQVIVIPLLLENGRCFVVAEFTRGWNYDPFSSTEFEIANAIFSWVNACVQKMKSNKMLRIQKEVNAFLIEVTKIMFDDLCNTDTLVDHIMIFTKELVSADRCALFLLDEERHELYADLFDEGKTSEDGTPVFTKKTQIRFHKDRGIAGYVAKRCKIVNIKDAYKDQRFNPDIDKQSGYHTKNILCMPISGKNGVIGVVQMINKLGGDRFSREDEEAFEMFAVYCAIALHYSKLYSALTRQQNMYKITAEVMEFHVSGSRKEAAILAADYKIPDDKFPANFYTFDFCAYDNASLLPKLFIRIVQDLFGNSKFDIATLSRFILTVRKNYRPVTYHNWEHAFHVAHSIWRMIKNSVNIEFTTPERMALIFGAICHDIDHRGYNNEFYRKLRLPLALMYPVSCLENHHYQQTIAVLQAEGNDIFSFLEADEYNIMLENIRNNILATDLALYFGNRKFLASLIEKNEFTAEVPEHRSSLISLMMTGADICAVSKPWTTQAKTIDFLYEEFWMQGDEEKKKGLEPLAMMDRMKKYEIPNQQIAFINFVCKPLYTTLSTLLPAARPLLKGCESTEENWQRILLEREERNKKPKKSKKSKK